MVGKNLVPEVWAKMFSAHQIAGFLNQLYLYNKIMKERDFICMLIHIHGNQTLIEKYWDEGGQKWVW